MQTRLPGKLSIGLEAAPRRRSSLLSAPHTPNCVSPPSSFSILRGNANRKSSDSWNSIAEDETEWEWKPENISLLQNTLEAVYHDQKATPFTGVPPSNLLDRIARGVSTAKGPQQWPHTMSQTRRKLVEIARERAKAEEAGIAEESEGYDPMSHTSRRRPLYRQSSMDFMNTAKHDIPNSNINKLSKRLYSPYPSRPSSPSSRPDSFPPSLSNPNTSTSTLHSQPSTFTLSSTTSCTTLNSSSACSSAAKPRALRRTASTLSIISNTSSNEIYPMQSMAADPRVQNIRLSDTLCAPSAGTPGQRQRVPSTSVRRNPGKRSNAENSTTGASSDEEERVRSSHAKRARVRNVATPPPVTSSPVPTPNLMDPVSSATRSRTRAKDIAAPVSPTPKRKIQHKLQLDIAAAITPSVKRDKKVPAPPKAAPLASSLAPSLAPTVPRRPRANLQRNPSIFGSELPQPMSSPVHTTRAPAAGVAHLSYTLEEELLPTSPPGLLLGDEFGTSPRRTLRRVRPFAPARRISFGSLHVHAQEQGDVVMHEPEANLGSAFQLN